jgi:putative thiamine transport system substrate-binding protein
VKRLRNEKPAGKLNSDGVDLAWINGENFLPMKCEGVLFAPFTHHLPNFKEIDVVGKPPTTIDFSEPRQSLEMPWSMTQLTFFADSKRISRRLEGMAELLAFAQANPAQVSHPRPSDLHGTTFLKQALLEASPDRRAVYKPVSPQARKANISTWGDSTVLAVDHLS